MERGIERGIERTIIRGKGVSLHLSPVGSPPGTLTLSATHTQTPGLGLGLCVCVVVGVCVCVCVCGGVVVVCVCVGVYWGVEGSFGTGPPVRSPWSAASDPQPQPHLHPL